jgi:hypothetical protein
VIDLFGDMRVATRPVLTVAAGRGVTECSRYGDRSIWGRWANFSVSTGKTRSEIATDHSTSPSKSGDERSERPKAKRRGKPPVGASA